MKTLFFFTYRAVLAFLLIIGFILAFAPALLLAGVAIGVSNLPKQRARVAAKPVQVANQAPVLAVAQ